MKTYIALLRGINVSGQKRIIMADFRALLEANGLSNVSTYIQSGNVVFKSEEEDKVKLENQITQIINKEYGFEVPVLVKTSEEIKTILAENPYTNAEDLASNKIYFALLKQKPAKENVAVLEAISFENETIKIVPKCVYLRCALGAGKAKCTNNLIEKKLKVSVTTRNYKTMVKLQELSLV